MVNLRRTWAVGAVRLTLPHWWNESLPSRSLGKPIAKVELWTTCDGALATRITNDGCGEQTAEGQGEAARFRALWWTWPMGTNEQLHHQARKRAASP